MGRKLMNQVKLGVFVMAGLAFLILLLYFIGKNQNMFGNTFVLKARFNDVHGLMPGNNIRFAGIDAGTVKDVDVLNDTTIEVTLLVKSKMKAYIHKNATVRISTDGLMGNRLINIESARAPAPLVEEGDTLFSTYLPDTDEMLKVLNTTNNDIAFIASQLKITVERLNNSKALWNLLDDNSLPRNIRTSLQHVSEASVYLKTTMANLDAIASDIRSGKGSIGQLLKDTVISADARMAISSLRQASLNADTLSSRISKLVADISEEINNGEGTAHALLSDREMKNSLDATMKNIEEGTRTFQQSMEALKNSFFFRGYFKKLEKQRKKDSASRL